MNLKQINVVGLILLSFFYVAQSKDTFAKEATQYQLYRLSDDASDDRRPKLAINDQGTVWVVWESDRDGDFDLYGKRFENRVWSDLIKIEQDSNETFISDAIFYKNNRLLVFGTEVDSIHWPYISGFLFYKEFKDNYLFEKKYVTYVEHWDPYQLGSEVIYNVIPQISLLNDSMIICYHRDDFSYARTTFHDSLFLRYFIDETWSKEFCDSVFFERVDFKLADIHHFPVQPINLVSQSLFLIKKEYYNGYSPVYQEIADIGLFINQHLEKKYVILNKISGYGYSVGDPDYHYGSNKNSIFRGNSTYIQQLKLNSIEESEIKRQWEINSTSNIKISQMSDLVAFVWSDSANIYIKTFQDSTWYETLAIPLNGLAHIEHSLNCAVYNNQQIWVTFDAIDSGNKDVYALSVPASFVVDTMMTEVNSSAENNASPNDLALFQNYPNPFNSSTTIKYQLPAATDVKLEIYNLLGQRIRTLVDQFQIPGSYSIRWDGTDDFNQPVASGLYLYQLKIKSFVRTNKLIVLQ